MVAGSFLRWLGASVAISSCHAQASLLHQLLAWCMHGNYPRFVWNFLDPWPSDMLLYIAPVQLKAHTLVCDLCFYRGRPFRHQYYFQTSRCFQSTFLMLPTSCCLRRRRRGYINVCTKICCRPYSQHILEEEFKPRGGGASSALCQFELSSVS